ncbi:unnamed protein product [Laminaria digitata]
MHGTHLQQYALACPDLGAGRSPSAPTTVHQWSYEHKARRTGTPCSLVGELLAAWGGGDVILFSTPMPRSSFPKQSRSIATAESVMGTAWGEEKPDIAWVRKHPDSEDASVGVGMGWDD